MAQLVLGAVGAAIGGFFGPVAASFGWSIGAAIGGYLAAPDQTGPRLADLSVQISSYGAGIPEIWGTNRSAGNVIWSTPLIESANTESAKGGPTITTYSYSVSCAVLICEGEMSAVRRIWADAKLVYDVSEDADEATQSASAAFAQLFAFYSGSETQLPDPTIESYEGVGNVEAYRGSCYIVFTGIPLGDFGNRIPNFSFELTRGEAIVDTVTDRQPLVLGPWVDGLERPHHIYPTTGGVPSEQFVVTTPDGTTVGTYDTLADAEAALPDNYKVYVGYSAGDDAVLSNYGQASTLLDGNGPRYVYLAYNDQVPDVVLWRGLSAEDTCVVLHDALLVPNPYLDHLEPEERSAYMISTWPNRPGGYTGYGLSGLVKFVRTGELADGYIAAFSCVPYEPNLFYPSASGSGPGLYFSDRQDALSGWISWANTNLVRSDFGGGVVRYYTYYDYGLGTLSQVGTSIQWGVQYTSGVYVGLVGPVYYTITSPTPIPQFIFRPHWWIRIERKLTVHPNTCQPGNPCDEAGIAEYGPDQNLCIACDGEISRNVRYELEAGTYKQLQALTYSGSVCTKYPLGPILPSTDPNYSSSSYWTAAAASAGVAGTYGVDFPVVTSSASFSTYDTTAVEAGAAVLGDIVSDLCVDAGLDVSQIDVSTLTDEVLGYARTKQMTARSAIEPLRSAFWFDGVESGDEIKFVMRGGAPIASLAVDDLGAGKETSNGEPVVTDRGQEAELPKSIVIAYSAQTADYQRGTQQSRRIVGGTQQAATIEIPVVLSDERAAQIADVLLYEAWLARNKRSISVGPEWSELEPTDVVLATDGEATYRIVLGDKSEDSGVFSFQGVDCDAETYAPNSTAGTPSGGGSAVRVDGPTHYELLDIPLLRDVDDSASMYLAAAGYLDGWHGGVVYRSLDGGVSFDPWQDVSRVAVLGLAESVLGDYLGGNTFDSLSAVSVHLNSGELASITMAQLLAGGNAAVLGEEVVQFKTATLTAERTYTLTGFLRGRVGTERFMATHEDGERFVLLSPATLYRPDFDLSLLNSALQYKAITFGNDLSSDTALTLTNTGAGLMPLAPVHLYVVALTDGYAGSWVRRSRYASMGVRLGLEAPLGETAELYRVQVFAPDGTEVESQDVSTSSATVGVGEDYDGYTVEVRQISSMVGVGYAATTTIARHE